MAKEIKTKASFGTVKIDHVRPEVPEEMPKALNLHISFEDAMRLHLGLGQILGKLNGYNRSTIEGKRSCVNLCVFLDVNSITINEGKTKQPPKKK